MRVAAILAAIFIGAVMVFAGRKLYLRTHRVASGVSHIEAPIEIRINPEARVSVFVTGPLPAPVHCGTAAVIPIEILNQGFVTARLGAQLVADPPAGVIIDFHSEPLRGAPEEMRALRITLTKRGPTDLTLAFRAHNEIPDLGGRDRIHFLMNCR